MSSISENDWETVNAFHDDELSSQERAAFEKRLRQEPALAEALKAGTIAGAGFDVLTAEPPKEGNILLDVKMPNFIVTPHVAWASREAMQILADQLMDNIDAFVAGSPQNVVE